eukprot:CAMPEP_0197173378 /NCGR_PEP_ID=MMETSP1423-20130617/337_1 /TAXON_ID=476441 /ORGANISM="Pseudo-nitzschia heimii, Strain UNC1101" /LENGTH=441 /DNA_ID=CAMNT_0042622193 /DNA_START=63 /DNA_END=1388 /DNA_ORIENTATION=+
MKFVLRSVSFVAAVLAVSHPSFVPGVRAEGTRSQELVVEIAGANPSASAGTGTGEGGGCTLSKKVTVWMFCRTEDLDQRTHQLILNDNYSEEERRFETQNACDVHTYDPIVMGGNDQMIVGAEIYDQLHGEIDEYVVEIDSEDWYDDTCGRYEIEISDQFLQVDSAVGCYTAISGMKPHLGIPNCLDVNGGDPPDHSYTWHIAIEPVFTWTSVPMTQEPTFFPTFAETDVETSMSEMVYLMGKVDWPSNWKDTAGDDCSWYAAHADRCDDAHLYEIGHSASQACVTCGGGVYRGNGKRDYPVGWIDANGYDCEDYAEHATGSCVFNVPGTNGMTAVDACVVCGGGTTLADYPEGWKDSHGDSCDWYADNTNWCDIEDADQVCAVCGGGGPVWDVLGFRDGNGRTCDHYALDPVLCEVDGDRSNADGISARVACIACGGGHN